MTFAEIQTAVLARFKQADQPNVKLWINLAYGMIWGLERWTFRRAEADVTVSIGSAFVTFLPTDLAVVLGLLNGDGDRLFPVRPPDWNDRYRAQKLGGSTGKPEAFTVQNGALVVGPPSSEASLLYRLEYLRSLTELDADADEPALPSEFHWLLVSGALAIGQAHAQDPTAVLQDPVIARGLDVLRRDFLIDLAIAGEQWGAWR